MSLLIIRKARQIVIKIVYKSASLGINEKIIKDFNLYFPFKARGFVSENKLAPRLQYVCLHNS
jgi:hypothetical protein